MGYNFFNINALTMPEVNQLIHASNIKAKEKQRAQKQAQSKSKGRKR